MQMRFNRRAPDQAMVLFEAFEGCVIDWCAYVCRRSGWPEITVCFSFPVRLTRR